MAFTDQIYNVCKMAQFHIQALRHIRDAVTEEWKIWLRQLHRHTHEMTMVTYDNQANIKRL